MELSEILFGSTMRSKSVVCCSLWKEGRNIAINQNYDQINGGQPKFKGNLSTMNQKCRHRFSSNFHFWTFNPPVKSSLAGLRGVSWTDRQSISRPALHYGKFFDISSKNVTVQLNKYETDPYILQIFQSDTSVCLIISVFCKNCEPMLCEPEIVQTFCS